MDKIRNVGKQKRSKPKVMSTKSSKPTVKTSSSGNSRSKKSQSILEQQFHDSNLTDKIPPNDDSLGNQIETWNLASTSSTSTVDHDTLLPIRHKSDESQEDKSSNLTDDEQKAADSEGIASNDEAHDEELMQNKSPLPPSSKSGLRSIVPLPELNETFPASGQRISFADPTMEGQIDSKLTNLVPPYRSKERGSIHRQKVVFQDVAAKTYQYVYDDNPSYENGGKQEIPKCLKQDDQGCAASCSEEIIVLKPSLPSKPKESWEAFSSYSQVINGGTFQTPVVQQMQVISPGNPPTHPILHPNNNNIGEYNLMTSEVDEYHSLVNNDDELDADLLFEDDDAYGGDDEDRADYIVAEVLSFDSVSQQGSATYWSPSNAVSSESLLDSSNSHSTQVIVVKETSTTSSTHSRGAILERFRIAVEKRVPVDTLEDQEVKGRKSSQKGILSRKADSRGGREESNGLHLLDEDNKNFALEKIPTILPSKTFRVTRDLDTSPVLPMNRLIACAKEKTVRFEKRVTHFLPTVSSSMTNIEHANASSNGSSSEVHELRKSPSESTIAMNHQLGLRFGQEDIQLEGDDEEENSNKCFPAHEVKSSMTLLRKKIYKNKKEKLLRLLGSNICGGGATKTFEIGTQYSNPTLGNQEMGVQANDIQFTPSSTHRSIQTSCPVLKSSFMKRPKSATESTASTVSDSSQKQGKTVNVTFKLIPGDRGESGDTPKHGPNYSAYSRRSRNRYNNKRHSSPPPPSATNQVLGHIVTALQRMQEKTNRPQTTGADPGRHAGSSINTTTTNYSKPEEHSNSTKTPANPPKTQGRKKWTSSHVEEKQKKFTVDQNGGNRPWSSPLYLADALNAKIQGHNQNTRPQTPKQKTSHLSNQTKSTQGKKKSGGSVTSGNHNVIHEHPPSTTLLGIRPETIERLATPKGLQSKKNGCTGKGSKGGRSGCSSRTHSKVSIPSGGNKGNTAANRAKPTEKLIGQVAASNLSFDKDGSNRKVESMVLKPTKTEESLQVLVKKRNLHTHVSTEGMLLEKKGKRSVTANSRM